MDRGIAGVARAEPSHRQHASWHPREHPPPAVVHRARAPADA
jgi:hypothetical protein